MSHFCLLRDPKTYSPHDWDLLADHSARAYWLEEFCKQFAEAMKHALVQYGRKVNRQATAAQQQFSRASDSLRSNPASLGSGKLKAGCTDH